MVLTMDNTLFLRRLPPSSLNQAVPPLFMCTSCTDVPSIPFQSLPSPVPYRQETSLLGTVSFSPVTVSYASQTYNPGLGGRSSSLSHSAFYTISSIFSVTGYRCENPVVFFTFYPGNPMVFDPRWKTISQTVRAFVIPFV